MAGGSGGMAAWLHGKECSVSSLYIIRVCIYIDTFIYTAIDIYVYIYRQYIYTSFFVYVYIWKKMYRHVFMIYMCVDTHRCICICSPDNACSKGSWRREKLSIVFSGPVSDSAGCVSFTDLYHCLPSCVKIVQIMSGFMGYRKIGFILCDFFSCARLGTRRHGPRAASSQPPGAHLPCLIILHEDNLYSQLETAK